jgi:hypothetical protein
MQLEAVMTPPKPKSPNPKVQFLHIRLNAAEMALLAQAADIASLAVSSWARERLLTDARRELRRAREQ